MAELNTALEQIQAAMRKYTSGIQSIPDYAPEDNKAFPFLVTFPGTGQAEWRSISERHDTHNIVMQLHVARKNLPYDIAAAVGFVEAIPAAMKTAEAAGELGAIENFSVMTYEFGPMAWASEEANTVGFTWIISGVLITHAY